MSSEVIVAILVGAVLALCAIAVLVGRMLRRASADCNDYFRGPEEAAAALVRRRRLNLDDPRHIAMLKAAGYGAAPTRQ